MSLQVWLPLNGNLNNQGLSDTTITNKGATVSTSGKIGSCYKCGVMYANDFTLNTEEFSVCYWVKYVWIGPHNSYVVSLNNSTSSDYQFMVGSLGNGTDNSATSTYLRINAASSGTIPIPVGEWHHCCATWKGTTVSLYVDGVFDKKITGVTVNSGATHLGINCRSNSTSGSGVSNTGSSELYLNDVRIYDHCLSAKEVKEISKGLICHYKLDNKGFGNPNLCPLNSKQEWTAVNTKTNYTILSTSTSNFGLSTGDTFTWSVYVKVPTEIKKLRARVQFYNSGSDRTGSTGSTTVTNGEGRVFVKGTVLSGYAEMQLCIDYNLSSDITTTNVVCYYKMPKLEKGSVATPWCPHTSDSLYTSLGLDSTTESDCSGLSNNGTKIGGLTSSTSPIPIRYESCYDFDGNTDSIQIPNLSTLVPSGEFTMNCWIYHDSTWSSKTWETIFGGPSGFELEAKNSSTNSPVLYAYSWGKGSATYELNKWNMITMTRNASETKFYINGELKITGSAGTIPSGNYFIGAWSTSSQQNYKGRISDFRLYSTVLSVEDIKELYNTSASVDKNGNMYAYEFKEE